TTRPARPPPRRSGDAPRKPQDGRRPLAPDHAATCPAAAPDRRALRHLRLDGAVHTRVPAVPARVRRGCERRGVRVRDALDAADTRAQGPPARPRDRTGRCGGEGLVRWHADRRGPAALQRRVRPTRVGARRSRRHPLGRVGARRSRPGRPRDAAAQPSRPPDHLGQPSEGEPRVRAPCQRHGRGASLVRRVPEWPQPPCARSRNGSHRRGATTPQEVSMKFENDFTVDAPVDEVWRTLLDVERVAPCMPGAEVTERIGEDAYTVSVKVKVGPMSMTYGGEVQIVHRDEQERRATMHVKAKEARGQGTADAHVHMSLAEQAGGTHAAIETEVQLSGRIAGMGQSVIGDVSAKLIETFAANLAAMLSDGGGPSHTPAAASPAGDSSDTAAAPVVPSAEAPGPATPPRSAL